MAQGGYGSYAAYGEYTICRTDVQFWHGPAPPLPAKAGSPHAAVMLYQYGRNLLMAPPRRSAPARTSAKSSPAPLPKGSRIPQPSLVYWIIRTLFIGSLVLFFASPSILTWASTHQPPAAPAGQPGGGLLTGLLMAQRPTAD